LPLFIEMKRGEQWAMAVPMNLRPGEVWKGTIRLPPSELAPAGRTSVLEVAVGPRKPFDFQAELTDLILWVGAMRLQAEKIARRADGLSSKRTITWLAQAASHKAVWVFHKLRRPDLPAATIEGFADGFKISSSRMGVSRIDVRVSIEDPKDPQHVLWQETTTSTRERPMVFAFPAKYISPDGTLRVAVERMEKDSYLGIPDRLRFGLYAQHGNFDWNFAKALLVIFFQLVLLSAVAVAGSTFLSAPVSVMFAFFVFFCGNLVDFMRNAATVLAWAGPSPEQKAGPSVSFWIWAWEEANKLVEVSLPVAAKVIPDLQQFDVAGQVFSGDEIPLAMVVNALVYFAAFGLFAIIVGQIVFRKKEIG
jgi:hypothetical protein